MGQNEEFLFLLTGFNPIYRSKIQTKLSDHLSLDNPAKEKKIKHPFHNINIHNTHSFMWLPALLTNFCRSWMVTKCLTHPQTSSWCKPCKWTSAYISRSGWGGAPATGEKGRYDSGYGGCTSGQDPGSGGAESRAWRNQGCLRHRGSAAGKCFITVGVLAFLVPHVRVKITLKSFKVV